MPRQIPEGRRFKTGNKANPKGAGAHNPALKALRRMTQADLADIGQLILESNLSELERIKDDPATSALRVMMCAIALKAARNGDSWAMEAILNRIIGKVQDKVQITGVDDGPIQTVSLTDVKEIMKKLDDEY